MKQGNSLAPEFRHVILDRDGVLNEEAPGGYVRSPAAFIWLPGALAALSELVRSGITLSVATNQSCVGRGIIELSDLERIHDKMKRDAAAYGVRFSGVYYCPHAPDTACSCRKPQPALIEAAIRESGIPRTSSLMIGDSARDLQAGQAAGIRTWLVRTGRGRETEAEIKNGRIKGLDAANVSIFDDLAAAGRQITDTHSKQKSGK